MKLLDLTLPSPAENLACDEALLDFCEAGGEPEGILRFWAPREYFVVVGYANDPGQEVNLGACRELKIPIFRRCTGGGAVLQGPGCQNYSLLLKIEGPLQGITETNGFVLGRHAAVLGPLLASEVSIQGHTDLAVKGQKFSGNSQRRKRGWLLFHGTFLLDFNAELMARVLRHPSKEPAYRQNRSHEKFLTTCGITSDQIKTALQKSWQAYEPLAAWPEEAVRQSVNQKYSRPEWNRA